MLVLQYDVCIRLHSGYEAFKSTMFPLLSLRWLSSMDRDLCLFSDRGSQRKLRRDMKCLCFSLQRLKDSADACLHVFCVHEQAGKEGKKEREWRSRREIRDLRCPVNTAGSNSRQSCHKAIDLAEFL